jgi:uncharacterized membrane protein YhfC
MVSDAVVISLYTLLIMMLTFPLMIAICLKIRRKTKFIPFLLGLLVYFTFAIVCPTFVHTIFLNQGRPTSAFLNSNVISYSAYYAIVVGILEELGIFVAFKKILVNYDKKDTALMYGLGHAGLDILFMNALSIVVFIIFATALNEKGVEGFKEIYADVDGVDLDKNIEYLTNISVLQLFLQALRYILFFVFHIFASIIVFYAAKKSTIQYYWIAVLLRGLLTIPGSIEKFENLDGTDIPQTVIMVICVLAIVAMAGFIALKLYKNYDSEQILMPKDLFSKEISPKLY